MIREPKNIDFKTTGRQLSAKEFGLISDWIKLQKKEVRARNLRAVRKMKKRVT